MLGRKDYTREELDTARTMVEAEVAAYDALHSDGALEAFEPLHFNALVLVLDRLFVHRVRVVSGKDGNPINEVELIADSLLLHGGTFRGSTVVKYDAARSVLGLAPGDPVRIDRAGFEKLAAAYLAEIETRFVA